MRVTYIEHIISENGIKTDWEKIKVLQGWPVVKSVKDVRKFWVSLGIIGEF